jgi:putative transposase
MGRLWQIQAMPRTARLAPGGMIFHVVNRVNTLTPIFAKQTDYAVFERVMKETLVKKPMRILDRLSLSNLWHLALWPEHDGVLAQFMHRLTVANVRCWHLHRESACY